MDDSGSVIPYEQVRKFLSIDPDDIEAEFIEAPEILAHFAHQYVLAEETYLKAKMHFEITEARLKLVHKEALLQAAKKAFRAERAADDVAANTAAAAGRKYKRVEIRLRTPTVGDIDSAVLVDPEYAEARTAYILAEVAVKAGKAWCDVGRVKRDMLTAIGMRLNAELRARPMDVAQARQSPSEYGKSGGRGPDEPAF